MRFISRIAIPVSTALIAVTACAGDPQITEPDLLTARAIPEELAGDVDAVVRANNAFAFDLYARLREQPGNLFLSPYSISSALSMTLAGAAGTTEREMYNTLRFTIPEGRVHPAAGALLASLDRGTEFGGYALQVANRLWAQDGFPFLDPFLATVQGSYQAGVEQVDFAGEPEACRLAINRWVEENTASRIKDLFPPGTIDGYSRLVLANAIWFKGTWVTQFDPAKTHDAPFRIDARRTVTAPLMAGAPKVRHGGDDGVAVVELPYKGKDLSMLVLLPRAEEGLAELESRLTVENLEAWMAGLVEREWELYLPRFSFTAEFGLAPVLAALGMPSAFSDMTADFSDMSAAAALFIKSVRHKAWVQVNEEGTEAAAATGVDVGVTSMPPQFRADHPFLFLIYDHVTGSVLFLGRVVDPTAS